MFYQPTISSLATRSQRRADSNPPPFLSLERPTRQSIRNDLSSRPSLSSSSPLSISPSSRSSLSPNPRSSTSRSSTSRRSSSPSIHSSSASPPISPVPQNTRNTPSPKLPTSPLSSLSSSPVVSPDSSLDYHMSTTTVPALPGLAPLTTFIGGKDAPILEKGNLTPSIFDNFKTAAIAFFRKTKITDDHEKALALLNSFHDPLIDSYIKNNKTRIHTEIYVFKNLFSDLHKRFLPPTWAMDLYRQTVNSKMLQNESFEDFCTRVVAGNNLLEGDTLHLSHENLRKTIEGNMAQYLADAIAVLSPEEHQKIDALADFYEWEAEILRVDRRFRSHVSYVQILTVRSAKLKTITTLPTNVNVTLSK
jgi:hypothetical protein